MADATNDRTAGRLANFTIACAFFVALSPGIAALLFDWFDWGWTLALMACAYAILAMVWLITIKHMRNRHRSEREAFGRAELAEEADIASR